MAIIISQDWLEKIKSIAAYPSTDMLILDDDQIKKFCISRAMQDYFTKFPLKEDYQGSLNGEYKFDFPDEYTIGVMDCRMVDLGIIGGTGSSFWELALWNAQAGNTISYRSGTGVYGKSGYNPNSIIQQREMSRQAIKSQQNLYSTVKFRVDLQNKQLIVFSDISGTVNITWAKYSDNWNDIRYTRQNEVCNLAQSYLLDHFCDTASIISDSSLETTINYSDIRQRATDMREKIIEKWNEIPDVILMRFV